MATRDKVVAIYAALIGLNVLAWALAFWAFSSHPILLGTAMFAYTFGLRHAVDADHISAIDNVTRKLMQEGNAPSGSVFFSRWAIRASSSRLSVAIASLPAPSKRTCPGYNGRRSHWNVDLCGVFFFVAGINLAVLLGIVRTFRRAGPPKACDGAGRRRMLEQRGLIGRFFVH